MWSLSHWLTHFPSSLEGLLSLSTAWKWNFSHSFSLDVITNRGWPTSCQHRHHKVYTHQLIIWTSSNYQICPAYCAIWIISKLFKICFCNNFCCECAVLLRRTVDSHFLSNSETTMGVTARLCQCCTVDACISKCVDDLVVRSGCCAISDIHEAVLWFSHWWVMLGHKSHDWSFQYKIPQTCQLWGTCQALVNEVVIPKPQSPTIRDWPSARQLSSPPQALIQTMFSTAICKMGLAHVLEKTHSAESTSHE